MANLGNERPMIVVDSVTAGLMHFEFGREKEQGMKSRYI